jgi:hypothetical protein
LKLVGLRSQFALPPGPFGEDDSCAYAIAAMLIRIHGRKARGHTLRGVMAISLTPAVAWSGRLCWSAADAEAEPHRV